METQTITDFAELRRPRGVEHAWAEGDEAAIDGVKRETNPYTEEQLRHAWDLGFVGDHLPDVSKHWVEVMPLDTLRTVSSLRAQCGARAWTAGAARHAQALDDRAASPEEMAA